MMSGQIKVMNCLSEEGYQSGSRNAVCSWLFCVTAVIIEQLSYENVVIEKKEISQLLSLKGRQI